MADWPRDSTLGNRRMTGPCPQLGFLEGKEASRRKKVCPASASDIRGLSAGRLAGGNLSSGTGEAGDNWEGIAKVEAAEAMRLREDHHQGGWAQTLERRLGAGGRQRLFQEWHCVQGGQRHRCKGGWKTEKKPMDFMTKSLETVKSAVLTRQKGACKALKDVSQPEET